MTLHFAAAQKGFQRGRKEGGSRGVLFPPAHSELPEQLFPERYVEGNAGLRTKLKGFFSSRREEP
jgi:hypothetical protein